MNQDLLAVTCATVVGILGTGLGGLAGCFGGGKKWVLPAVLGFTAGLMASVACFELVPQAYDLGGMWVALLSTAAGIFVVWGLSAVLPGGESLEHTGLLVLVAIALHNLPEGLAIGSGWAAVPSLGIKLALIIGLHDFPEGMAVTAPMAAVGRKPLRQVLLALLTGVPTGFGALLGVCLGGISQQWVAGCIGFAGGAMLYVTAGEMVPRLHDAGGRGAVLWQMLGCLAGALVSWL